MTLFDAPVNASRVEYQLGLRGLRLPARIVKRDGTHASFDLTRIGRALQACYDVLSERPGTDVGTVVQGVASAIAARYEHATPTVEQVQDLVELTLLSHGELEAATAYIAYRDARSRDRGDRVPAEIRDAFADSERYFPSPLQQFQYFDKYSRWNWELGRRETWVETVDRVVDYLRWLVREHGSHLDEEVFQRIHGAILRMEVMPSMRALSQAGPAAQRNGLAIYNCSYAPLVDARSFGEIMRVSMAGCGVGWSVERDYVEQFPRIQRQSGKVRRFVVEDSAEGWASATEQGVETLFAGWDVEYDYSLIRPQGAPLLTKGGRASGPAPLMRVHEFARQVILSRQGQYLTTLDAHDIACVTAGAAVSGGVRRTAAIALFDWDDQLMWACKTGEELDRNPHRWNANNSAVWPEGLTQAEVASAMLQMVQSQRGEPGIFSRANAIRTKPERRQEARFGTNPCGEINLRPFGLCNLSIAVARPEDTPVDLYTKVELATIIGTIQSLATNFPGMREEWKRNAEEERLLGVDITGQADNWMLSEVSDEGRKLREGLKDHAVRVNQRYAQMLGINPAASITCNKPSGNSSQLLNTSSGIHRRFASYYIRRTRVSAATPLFRVLRDAGVPLRPENGQTASNADTWVASWPVRAPEGVRTAQDYSAVDQCEFWLLNKLHWTEHNPSVTINYRPDEVLDLIQWVWEHRDVIGGMAFLPASDAQYEQMPYEEISAEEYHQLVAELPHIDFSLLHAYEHSDMTTAAQELACMSGACDI